MQFQFDQDPQGMNMPFKEFVIKDAMRDIGKDSRQVVYEFPNGYGLSVVMGELFYTDDEHPYEVCPLYKGKMDYQALDPSNDDVYPRNTDEDLYIMIVKLQALPPKGEAK